MRRTLLLFVFLFSITELIAEDGEKAIYIYRNDNHFNAFFYSEIDSITFSKNDVIGFEHDEYVTQEVWTRDSTYRIPLNAIDSISFIRPETIYKENVRFGIRLFDYLISELECDSVFLFDKTMPVSVCPQKGEIFILREGENSKLPFGFLGKVSDVCVETDGYKVSFGGISSLSEIFKQYVNIERVTPLTDNELLKKTAITDKEILDTEKIMIDLPIENDNVHGSAYGSLTGNWEAIVESCIIDNQIEANSLRINHVWWLDLGINLKTERHFKFPYKPNYIKALRAPLLNGIVWFEFAFSPLIVKGEGSIDFDVKFSSPKFGGRQRILFGNGNYALEENIPFDGGGYNCFPDFSAGISLNGNLKIGTELDFSLRPVGRKEWIKVGLDIMIGPKLQGSMELAKLQQEDYYNRHKDDKLQLSLLDMEIGAYWKSYFLGEEKKSIGGNLSYSTLEFERYLFPEFSNLSINTNSKNRSVTIVNKPGRNLILPSAVGIGLYGGDNTLLEEGYESDRYWTSDDSFLINQSFFSLERSKIYSVCPIVKLFGGTIKARPESIFVISPYIETGKTVETNYTSAVIRGFVDGIEGLKEEYLLGFRFSSKEKDPNSTNSNMITSSTTTDGTYEVSVTELTPNTTYYYRAYLWVDGKEYFGDVNQFTTKNLDPKALTGKASDVGENSANIECTYLNVPDGAKCGIEYTWNNGSSLIYLGTIYGSHTTQLSNLQSETTYTYCAFIEFEGKTYYGADCKFTTKEAELPDVTGTWTVKEFNDDGSVYETFTVTLSPGGIASAYEYYDYWNGESHGTWSQSKKGVSIHLLYYHNESETPVQSSEAGKSLGGVVDNIKEPTKIEGSSTWYRWHSLGGSAQYDKKMIMTR